MDVELISEVQVLATRDLVLSLRSGGKAAYSPHDIRNQFHASIGSASAEPLGAE